MNRIIRLRDGSSLDLLGLGVLAIVLATVVLVVMIVLPTVSMYQNPPKAASGTRDSATAAKKHTETVAWQREQVVGRSMFYKPRPPEYKEETTVAKYYGGPSLLAYVNGTAWFSDGQKVSAKEPDGKTVHFVSAKPPWSVRVRWEGGEFDVKLFDKTELSSLGSSSSLGVSWPSLGGSTTPQPTPGRMGDPPSARTNLPPEARLGPGAGGGDGSTPPPPPGGGAGGGGGDAPPPNGPPPASTPTPAPQPAPTGDPAPILQGVPIVPSPPQSTPSADPHSAPETSKPTHP